MPEINKNEWITYFEQGGEKESDSHAFGKYYQNQIDSLKSGNSIFEFSYVDIFCKKEKSYYVFEVKHKTYKKNKNMNRFYLTNYEVLNFNRIVKENKTKLKILIILEKGKKSFYRIFDWNEFIVPNGYDPNKKNKTSVRLVKGFDISSLKEPKR